MRNAPAQKDGDQRQNLIHGRHPRWWRHPGAVKPPSSGNASDEYTPNRGPNGRCGAGPVLVVGRRALTHNPRPMAKCFETWTVLPHGPLEKLNENLWRIEGTMPDGKTKRVMTIARMKDGRLVIHNAIALEPALQAEIEAFGTPACIVVPNLLSPPGREDLQRPLPGGECLRPGESTQERRKTRSGGRRLRSCAQRRHRAPLPSRWVQRERRSARGEVLRRRDRRVQRHHLQHAQIERRRRVLLGADRSAVRARFSRWLLVKDKGAFMRHVNSWVKPDLKRIIVGHGPMLPTAQPTR